MQTKHKWILGAAGVGIGILIYKNRFVITPDKVASPEQTLAKLKSQGKASLIPNLLRTNENGRVQLLLTSENQENQLGATEWNKILAATKKCNNPTLNEILLRVGVRIASVVPQRGFDWEFVLFNSTTPNAFCLPGGHVGVWAGILPYCRNEAGLASVLGHEIAHAILRHGGERVTQSGLLQNLNTGLTAAMKAKGISPDLQSVATQAFGVGETYGIQFPYSRLQENEADLTGQMYMAQAGYDPRESVAFWQRFSAMGDATSSKWWSTHPMNADRIRALQENLPITMQAYMRSPQYGLGAPIPIPISC